MSVNRASSPLLFSEGPQWPIGLVSLASNHSLSPVLVRLPQVALLWVCPNMTLAVEQDIKPQL